MHHCSDEALLSHLDAELDAVSDKSVVDHLGTCWSCRNRLALLEKQIHRLVEISERGIFPGPVWRNAAEIKLKSRISDYQVSNLPWLSQKLPWLKFSLLQLSRAAWLAFFIGMLLVGGAFLLIPPKIEAKAILLRSVEMEKQVLSKLRAQHKTWSVEQHTAGKMVARRRVEHWQGSNAIPAALRVYDEHHTLVAGEWISKTGLRTRYRKGQAMATTSSSTMLATLGSIDDIELFKLSTQEFLSLVGNNHQTEIRKDSDSLIVEFAAQPSPAAIRTPKLLKATLILTEDGLRPTEGVLVVASSNDSTEYRLQETSLERYVNEPPPAHVFDQEKIAPPPTLITTAAMPKYSTPIVPAVPEMLPSTNPSLELRIIQRLALENITLGEQIRLERKQDGRLNLHIQVASEEKKMSVEASLAGLLTEGDWTINFTIDPEKKGSTQLRTEPRLFRQWASSMLIRKGETPTDETVEQLAQQEIALIDNKVQRMRDHAIAIREIGGRFRQSDLDRLSEDERDDWKTEVFRHIQALQTEAILLHRELAGLSEIEPPEGAPLLSNGMPTVQLIVQDTEHLHLATKRLFHSTSTLSSRVDKLRDLLRIIQICQTRLDVLALEFRPQQQELP